MRSAIVSFFAADPVVAYFLTGCLLVGLLLLVIFLRWLHYESQQEKAQQEREKRQELEACLRLSSPSLKSPKGFDRNRRKDVA